MIPHHLIALKTGLFALLAALLIILCSAVYMKLSEPPEEERFFCGNAAQMSQLNEQQSHGKELFVANCASCHNKNMKDALTGPALGPALRSWEKYPKKDLYRFIRNSQGMIEKRHPRALEVWKEYQPVIMSSFSGLTDEDIEAILAYIRKNYG